MKRIPQLNKILLCNLFIIFLNQSCINTRSNSNQLEFNINPENRKIVIPLLLDDSIKVNMTFDTGAATGTFHLDSSFCASHPSLLLNKYTSNKRPIGSGWSSNKTISFTYESAPSVKIGKTELNYDRFSVYNYRKYYRTDNSNGMFSIPENDTLHVWELNFEHNYLEVHLSKNFKMPNDCFIVPITKNANNSYPFNIQLSLNIICSNEDTTTINRTFLIDTAASWDVVLMKNAEETSFFNRIDGAVWISYLSSYFKYFTVQSKLSNDIQIDSLRIYTFNEPKNPNISYIIGQNFLKRFNVFFDMKNQRIGLQPIENFVRISNPNYHLFHFSTYQTKQGKIIVKDVGNYKENYYKTAGFRSGDEILNVNGKLFKTLTQDEIKGLHNLDSLKYDIIRDGRPIEITVHVNQSEKKGD